MAILQPLNSIFNFPAPPNQGVGTTLMHPSDLTGGGKKFYTDIQFVQYKYQQQIGSVSGTTADQVRQYSLPSGPSVKLPIPMKLNDNLILNWSSISVTDMVGKAGGQFAGAALSSAFSLGLTAGSIGAGVALNPLMFLQFQRPEFRQFSLSWLLAPKNKKESETIRDIIKAFKRSASPYKHGGGLLMGYPDVATIVMKPDDIFGNLVFKPCVVTSVQVNYNGAPNPSFFKNGAPTVIALTLNLMEMQFWFAEEIE
jgi:hypothetical protein